MASNMTRFIRNNLTGAKGDPSCLIAPGLFQAGATQAVKMGEILEKTAGGNTQWVPMDSDYAMDSDVAVAAREIKSGDLAGYYPIIVPRPGDVFSYELAASGSSALGTALYWSDSETVTVTAGTNVIGYIAGWPNYPWQGSAANSADPDKGTTLRSVARVEMSFKESVSFWTAFHL